MERPKACSFPIASRHRLGYAASRSEDPPSDPAIRAPDPAIRVPDSTILAADPAIRAAVSPAIRAHNPPVYSPPPVNGLTWPAASPTRIAPVVADWEGGDRGIQPAERDLMRRFGLSSARRRSTKGWGACGGRTPKPTRVMSSSAGTLHPRKPGATFSPTKTST